MTTTDTIGKVAQAAVAAGWNAEDVNVLPYAELDTRGCTFFHVVHKRIMDGPTLEFVVLPDGRVVGGDPAKGDGGAAAGVLRACGADASAEWWAEVVTKFSGQAAGKVVKSAKNAADVSEIERRGGSFSPPSLQRDGDAARLEFFAIEYEPTRPFKVVAHLAADGRLDIVNQPLAQ